MGCGASNANGADQDGAAKKDEVVTVKTGDAKSAPAHAALKVIIAGAPASGKGTQCELIVEKFGLVHLSTGDLLREEVKNGTEAGKTAKEFMDRGDLVPDEVIVTMVKSRLAQPDAGEKGWLLDGSVTFPRAASQAVALQEANIEPDIFLLLDVPDDAIVERVVGRRLDPETGKIYHLKFAPPPEDIKERLQHRSDDTEDKCRNRLKVYHDNVNSVRDKYTAVLKNIDGNRDKHAVFADIEAALKAVEPKAKLAVRVPERKEAPAPAQPAAAPAAAPEPAAAPAAAPEPAAAPAAKEAKPAAPAAAGPLKVIIAGAPASGKGTQCELIVEKYKLVHLSTGDLLREEVKSGTEAGLKAKEFMDRGDLVPDEVIVTMVKSRLAQPDCGEKGWLLDGFPRAGSQAEALEAANIRPDVFVLLDVPDDAIVERVVGRRLDPETGKIYHLKFAPPPEDIAERLQHRSDDTEDKCRNRLKVYHDNVNNVRSYYEAILKSVDGNRDKHAVFADVCGILDAAAAKS